MTAAGAPPNFPSTTTNSFLNIGAVQKLRSSAGFPGAYPSSTSISSLNIGAVQKDAAVQTVDMWQGFMPPFVIRPQPRYNAPTGALVINVQAFDVSKGEWKPEYDDIVRGPPVRHWLHPHIQFFVDALPQRNVSKMEWQPEYADKAPAALRGALHSTYEFYTADEFTRVQFFKWTPEYPDEVRAARRGALYATYQFESMDEAIRLAGYEWTPSYPDQYLKPKRAYYDTELFYSPDEAVRLSAYNWRGEYPDNALRKLNWKAIANEVAFVDALAQRPNTFVDSWQLGTQIPVRRILKPHESINLTLMPIAPPAYTFPDAWQLGQQMPRDFIRKHYLTMGYLEPLPDIVPRDDLSEYIVTYRRRRR